MCTDRMGTGRRAASFFAVILGVLPLSGCTDILANPPLPAGAILWEVPGAGHGIPAHDKDMLYATNSTHELMAIEKRTGIVRWRSRTGSTGAKTRGYGTTLAGEVVVTSDRSIHAFDRSTGTALWVFAPAQGFPGYSLLTSDSASVYVGSASYGYVWALDARTGAVRWRAQVDTGHYSITWDPVLHEGALYVGLERLGNPRTGGVVVLDGATGAERWRRAFVPAAPSLGSGGTGPVAIAGDVVVAAANDGSLWALLRTDGRVKWHAPPLESAMVHGDDTRPLAVLGDVVVAASASTIITGYHAETGRVLWSLRPREMGSVWGWLATDGAFVYATSSGKIAKIDAAGRVLWTRGQVSGSPCFEMGAVVDAVRVYSSGCTVAVYAMSK